MKANETTIRNLLQGERQYVVPLYQRRYSWKRRDMAQLWADLMRVVEAGDTSSHFLGSVVLAPSPTNTPAGVQSWLVVDGQQRLTTLSILLCAVRDHVRDTDQQLVTYLDFRTRRWPTTVNPHFFINHITASRLTAGTHRWVNALVLGLAPKRLRDDRILHEAVVTGGNHRRLHDLFGLSVAAAHRYVQAMTD